SRGAVPIVVLEAAAGERHEAVVAGTMPLLQVPQTHAAEQRIRLLLGDALIALGRDAEAARVLRPLRGPAGRELLLSTAARLAEEGAIEDAWDAALGTDPVAPPAE